MLPVWLIPAGLGALAVVSGLAGSQVKDIGDSVFKEPGGGVHGNHGGGIGKGDILFYLIVAGAALYIIDKGKKVL